MALRKRGIEARTMAEAGWLGIADPELLARCASEGRVLVTQDRGFIRLHHQQRQHAGIAYSERGSRSVGELVASLALIHGVLEEADMVGQVEFL
jgi:predicted nuclease of predicted toxin-antitoxin system